MLSHKFDVFNGIIVDPLSSLTTNKVFSDGLDALVVLSQEQAKAVIWLTLPIGLAHLVSLATQRGFTFHNCLSDEITMIHKSKASDFAPYVPTHSLGAGGFVQNTQGEILVIRERGGETYKLPGGHIELGESIEDAVKREVFEETGVSACFHGVLGMASTHPYHFGKSNIYMVCKLTPLSTDIDIQDTHEIEDAQWIMPEVFLQDPNNSVFNKVLVKSLLGKEGLLKSELDLRKFSKRKHEVFLA